MNTPANTKGVRALIEPHSTEPYDAMLGPKIETIRRDVSDSLRSAQDVHRNEPDP